MLNVKLVIETLDGSVGMKEFVVTGEEGMFSERVEEVEPSRADEETRLVTGEPESKASVATEEASKAESTGAEVTVGKCDVAESSVEFEKAVLIATDLESKAVVWSDDVGEASVEEVGGEMALSGRLDSSVLPEYDGKVKSAATELELKIEVMSELVLEDLVLELYTNEILHYQVHPTKPCLHCLCDVDPFNYRSLSSRSRGHVALRRCSEHQTCLSFRCRLSVL